jgi:hypothetical protein
MFYIKPDASWSIVELTRKTDPPPAEGKSRWPSSRGDRRIGRRHRRLNRFFGSMPADSGLAFVVLHLDPCHHSELASTFRRALNWPPKTYFLTRKRCATSSCRHFHDGVRFTAERCGLSEPRQTDTCSAANSFLFRSPSVGNERAGGVL